MIILLVISYWHAGQWQGFDTYYIDHRGQYSGAFLNNRPFFDRSEMIA